MARFTNAEGQDAGSITHTDFMHAAGTRDRFTLDVTCPYCGQRGKITWEENDSTHRQDGSERRLIDAGPGFHAEEGRIQSGDPVIVCNQCDAILPN